MAGRDGYQLVSEPLDIPHSEIEDALSRLLADPSFQVSDRNKRFLQYVVERELQGTGREIRAYAIATSVFGRPLDFDASLDPIVRIEATRLRAALKHYYETQGRSEPIRIDLPKGGYAPSFSRQASSEIRPPLRGQAEARRWPNWLSAAIVFAALLVAGSMLLAGWVYFRFDQSKVLQKPLLVVEVASDEGTTAKTDELKDMFMASLARFERWRVSDSGAAKGSAGAPFHTYKLDVRIRPATGGDAIWWQLTDDDSGELLRSDVIRDGAPGQTSEISDSIHQLADWLGGSRGLVNSIEISRFGEGVPLGYGCIAWMEAEIWLWDRTRLSGVRDCLEATISAAPDDPQYLAALARVLMRSESFDGPYPLSKRALDLATRATQLAPYSSQTMWALSIATLRNGDWQRAASIARRAQALNPDDLTLRSFVGTLAFLTGNYDEGVSLILSSDNGRVPLSVEAYIALALDSYRRGDYAQVIERTQPATGPKCLCTLAARAVAFAKLGQMDQAKAELENLRKLRPSVASDFSEGMGNRGIPSEITASLRRDLAEIGFSVN